MTSRIGRSTLRRLARTVTRPRRVTGGPAVSIVIPTYNRARLLPESMESVLAQNYADLELLVVDDGSSDETPAVLKRYAERHPPERFRFVRQANAGQSKALNHGYGIARGELIGYLPDDDLLAPTAVAMQARALVANPRAALAYSGYRVIDERGAVEDLVRPMAYSPVEALRLHDTVVGPGGLVRRWALEASGGWPEGMRFIGDLVLWMDIGLRGEAVRISAPLVSWRRHPGSVTVNLGAEHAREHLIAYQRGLALDGLPPLSEAVRAEGLRNACVWGAIFGGPGDSWPAERYLVFDFHRKTISAAAAGCGLGSDPDWDRARQAAALYRELVEVMVELCHERDPPPPQRARPAGIAAAVERLREIGALANEDGTLREVDLAQMRRGLIDAAVACGAVTDDGTHRFGILDLERTRVRDDERARLEELGFAGSADELESELERRRHELARERGEPRNGH